MKSATFLLAINFSIGLSFATCFLALTWRSGIRLGRWCAAGFLFATATVSVEAFAYAIPSVRLTSTLSFGTLMLALTTMAIGLIKHYRPGVSVAYLVSLCTVSIVFNALVVFDFPRGTWEQGLGYQTPFAAVLATAGGVVISQSRRRPADLALAAILFLSSAPFLIKGILAGLAGSGPSVRDYIISTYAFYSQTAGTVLSILLGLSLIGVIVTEVIEESKLRLQRDMLSGVLNRSAFMDKISAFLKRSAAGSSSLIICDLDHFKSVNDRFGHAAGDEVIRAFGANLRSHFGEDAFCGRLGGEEFCLLLPDCDAETTRAHLEAVRLLARQNRYALIPSDVAVTASFGVAMMVGNEPFDRALHRADMAMYEAKAAGRDCYRFASESMSERDHAAGSGPFRL
jgi:diguanylate cyclase (GGDEF)-like protein